MSHRPWTTVTTPDGIKCQVRNFKGTYQFRIVQPGFDTMTRTICADEYAAYMEYERAMP